MVVGFSAGDILGAVYFDRSIEERAPIQGRAKTKEFAYLNLLGDGMHNFIDGMVIAAGTFVSPMVGIASTIAIIFHELPQEMGD